MISQPGFTTKYNTVGTASTGIGLTHVKEVEKLLNGHVRVESDSRGYPVSCRNSFRTGDLNGVELPRVFSRGRKLRKLVEC